MFLSVKFCAGISSVAGERAIRLHVVRCPPRGQETAGTREQSIRWPGSALH